MAFNVAAFLSIAERLQFDQTVSSRDEATIRTTAGRMYYAAYLATRESLRIISGDPRYDLNHSAMVAFLERQKDAGVSQIGGQLRELMDQRKCADYHPDRPIDFRTVGIKLRDAKLVLAGQALIRARITKTMLPPSERLP